MVDPSVKLMAILVRMAMAILVRMVMEILVRMAMVMEILVRMAMVMEGAISQNQTPTDQEKITMAHETIMQGTFLLLV